MGKSGLPHNIIIFNIQPYDMSIGYILHFHRGISQRYSEQPAGQALKGQKKPLGAYSNPQKSNIEMASLYAVIKFGAQSVLIILYIEYTNDRRIRCTHTREAIQVLPKQKQIACQDVLLKRPTGQASRRSTDTYNDFTMNLNSTFFLIFVDFARLFVLVFEIGSFVTH